jgi:hypothetical protein
MYPILHSVDKLQIPRLHLEDPSHATNLKESFEETVPTRGYSSARPPARRERCNVGQLHEARDCPCLHAIHVAGHLQCIQHRFMTLNVTGEHNQRMQLMCTLVTEVSGR